MKKLIILILFTFSLIGCSNQTTKPSDIDLEKELETSNIKEYLYIQPTEFSNEVEDVLNIIKDEIQFYDISLDEHAKSFEISAWIYQNNTWEKSRLSFGEISYLSNRFALRLNEQYISLYLIDDTGYTETKYSELYTSNPYVVTKVQHKLNKETKIKLNEEVPLWVQLETNDFSVTTFDLNDFKNNQCIGGIAITLTIFDK